MFPNIEGGDWVSEAYNMRLDTAVTPTGAFFVGWSDDTDTRGYSLGDTLTFASLSMNASRSNTIYGKSVTVQPPSLRTVFIIRFQP